MGINLEERVTSQRSRTYAEGHARERARGKYLCSSWEVRKSLTCVWGAARALLWTDCKWWWCFEMGGGEGEKGRLKEMTEGRESGARPCPQLCPRRECGQSSWLVIECCTYHALLIFYLPANHILLNIPASSFLDSCSSGWSWFMLT